MNSTKERIKTVLILVLIVGMFYLTYAVWFYDSPFGELRFDSFFDISVYEEVGSGADSDIERFGIRPLAIAVSNGEAIKGAIYNGERADEIYGALRDEVSQCFKKAQALASSSSEEWENALSGRGVLLDYRSDVPVAAVKMWLTGATDEDARCGRYYIFSTEKRNVKIYIKNSVNGNIFSAETDIPSSRVKEKAEAVAGFDVTLAAKREETEFRAIMSETLIPQGQSEYSVLSAYNSAESFSAETSSACLDAFGLRGVSLSQYNEADGAEVYIADRVTLRIEPDGTAVYTDTREEADEVIGITVESEGEIPTLAEKTEGARKLTASLAAKLRGDGGIYIASISETSNGTEIIFGRHVGGIPVDMKETLYFSSITIKGKSVRSARFNLRGYTKTAKYTQIVPERIAAAAVYGSGKSGDLNLRYQETAEAEIFPMWYIGGIKNESEKEAE